MFGDYVSEFLGAWGFFKLVDPHHLAEVGSDWVKEGELVLDVFENKILAIVSFGFKPVIFL